MYIHSVKGKNNYVRYNAPNWFTPEEGGMPPALAITGSRTQKAKWYIINPKTGKHYRAEQNPSEPSHFISTYSAPSDLVLDSTCGTMVTGMAAMRTGRRCILIDRDTESGMLGLAWDRLKLCYRFLKDMGLLPPLGSDPLPPQKWEIDNVTWQAKLLERLKVHTLFHSLVGLS